MAATQIITKGNRAVVINEQDGRVWANLYVNARGGIERADITMVSWKGKTVKGAQRWAAKQLADPPKTRPGDVSDDDRLPVKVERS